MQAQPCEKSNFLTLSPGPAFRFLGINMKPRPTSCPEDEIQVYTMAGLA